MWHQRLSGRRQNEGAIVTARSYHTGIVNVLAADGSVRSVSDSIDLATWRAYGTGPAAKFCLTFDRVRLRARPAHESKSI